jgi:DNA polymerase I-like protein with 3'-5' exonuclease and polymerase domains
MEKELMSVVTVMVVVEQVSPEIKKIMENSIDSKMTKGVPIVVDVSVGENWGKMEKLNKE